MIQKKSFSLIHYAIPEEHYDLAYAVLSNQPVLGVEELHDEIVVCFSSDVVTDHVLTRLLTDLRAFIPAVEWLRTETVEQQNWNEAWEKSLEPIVVSERIAITPSWHAEQVAHEITIVIDPKMSFGTGYHATTRLCARLLEEFVRPGSTWIDAGTGTGVLAISAVKLGAGSVFAFDNDEWSISNAEENIARNMVADSVTLTCADVNTVHLPQADGVVANLYRNVLIPVLDRFRSTLGKADSPLILSGVLQYDEEELRSEADQAGLVHMLTRQEDEWLAMVFRRK